MNQDADFFVVHTTIIPQETFHNKAQKLDFRGSSQQSKSSQRILSEITWIGDVLRS